MTCETKTWLVLHLILLATCCMQHCVHGQSQVPGIFIFGDSFCDNGNNNNLATLSKANYKPYGIDFPTRDADNVTGRFTNGPTAIDYIAQLLGFVDFIPPFANTTGYNISKGVNYASGGSGIRYETGKLNLGDNIALGFQVRNHLTTVSQIVAKLGVGGIQQAREYLKKCLYYVNIGSNDYINNYFKPDQYITSQLYTLDQYADDLINRLSIYIKILHGIGARKFVLNGLAQIGCSLNAIATRGNNVSCAEDENAAALMFSIKLKSLVDQINTQYLDSKAIFVNVTAVIIDISLGYTVFTAPCCPVRGDGQCAPNSIPCPNREISLFFDEFHTTSPYYNRIAINSYNSATNPAVTYPMDIQQLAQY